jgi:hypothetical protein
MLGLPIYSLAEGGFESGGVRCVLQTQVCRKALDAPLIEVHFALRAKKHAHKQHKYGIDSHADAAAARRRRRRRTSAVNAGGGAADV